MPGECQRCGGNLKVSAKGAPGWLVKPLDLVTENFDILDLVASVNRVELEVSSPDPKCSFRSLLNKLKKVGYLPVMRERNGELWLAVVKYPEVKTSNILINIILLALTILTTFVAGYLLFGQSFINAGLFSGSLMLMLGSHEIGHKIAMRRNGVASTMPYFIPFLSILGTLGAVIKIKSPIPTKEALVEMGSSGPLIGFGMALGVTFFGLYFQVSDPMVLSWPFVPGIFALLQLINFGQLPSTLALNPLLFAGWVVMLLTMLNLIPAGQLDGGHIARGLLSRRSHYLLTRALGFSLLFFGFLLPEYPFWIWGLLIIILFRGHHTGALDDVSELSSNHKALAIMALLVLFLCIPLPLL